MKKKMLIVPFLTLGVLLSGCVNPLEDTSTDESSESSTDTDTPDTPIDGHYDMWSEEEQELLKKYCGEVLPYPADLIENPLVVQEASYYGSDYNEYFYLEIVNESGSFVFKDYYKLLESFNWSAISSTYSGNVVQVDSTGVEFVEVTKANAETGVGYDLLYFYSEGNLDEDGVEHSYNILRCYNDLDASGTTDTAYDDDDLETIDNVLTTEIPFIALGERYAVYQTSENTLQVFDAYAKDLTTEILTTLKNDGYTIDSGASTYNDAFILTKKLDDGASINVMVQYFGGNTVKFYYTPNTTTSTDWPAQLASEIKDESGVSIPSFEVAEGGSYFSYKKHNKYYIYTYDLKDDYDYEEYALNQIAFIDLSWNETVSFGTYNLIDEDYNTIGFMLTVEITSPTSTFVTTYPNDVVNETIKTLLGVSDVTLPEFTDFTLPKEDKDVKYVVYGQEYYEAAYEYYYEDIAYFPGFYGLDDDASEEEIAALAQELAKKELGIVVSIYDVDFKAYEEYESILNNEAWYRSYDDYGNTVYEDPTGTLAVTFSGQSDSSHNDEGTTSFFVHLGSGEAHEPEFYFSETEINVCQGLEQKLDLNVNMLPGTVTFTSDKEEEGITVDENGTVTVSENTPIDTVATITASITSPSGEEYSETCTLTVVEATYYTTKSAIDAVAELIRAKGYDPEVTYKDPDLEDYSSFDHISLNLGTEMTQDELKSLVNNNFALEGFEPVVPDDDEDDWDDWDDYDDYDLDSPDYAVRREVLDEETTDPDIDTETGTDTETDSETVTEEIVWKDGTLYIGDDEYDCVFLDYTFYNEFCYIMVSYYIYEVNGDLMLFVISL